MTESVLKIISEVKYQPLFRYFSEIDSSINEFETLISSYCRRKPKLRKELGKLIDNFKAKNIEYQMVNYLDVTALGSETFMATFIDRVKLLRGNNACEVNSSPVKFVYDFYLLIALKVHEASSLLSACYALQEKLKNKNASCSLSCIGHESDNESYESYLNNRKVAALAKLRVSMKNSLEQLEEPKYLSAFINLSPVIDCKPILALNGESKKKFYTGPETVEREGL